MPKPSAETTKQNHMKWLDILMETGDPNKATIEVYPDIGKNAKDPAQSIYARTSRLKKELIPKLLDRLNLKLSYGAYGMLSVVNDLAHNEEQPGSVRLGAAKDWLDRAQIGTQKDANQGQGGVQIVINNQPVKVDSSNQSSVVIDVVPED